MWFPKFSVCLKFNGPEMKFTVFFVDSKLTVSWFTIKHESLNQKKKSEINNVQDYIFH